MAAALTTMTMAALLLLASAATWVSATDYVVGDTSGWTSGYDYSTWTAGKTFSVGDNLVFNYAAGSHTVNEATPSDYSACNTGSYLSTDSSGTTTVALKTAGTRYFMCGVPGHCAGGQKLAVVVSGASNSSAPPSTPTSPATPASPNYGTVPTHAYPSSAVIAGALAPAAAAAAGLAALVLAV